MTRAQAMALDLRTAPDDQLAAAAHHRIVSDEYPVDGFELRDGLVFVNGEPALDAKGHPVRRRETTLAACQRCGRSTVTVPLRINTRFEPALGRRMYFHVLALSFEALCALRCDECTARRAA
jgi:hypothetical protein